MSLVPTLDKISFHLCIVNIGNQHLSSTTMQNSTKWIIDPSHTKVGFSVRHFGISETYGFFRNYTAQIKTEKEDFSDLQVKVSIAIDSIDTNDAQRDAHLKADDFFNAEKFPEMKF